MPVAFRERLLGLGLVLSASLAPGCAGPGAPSGLPVEDDFTDCSTGWSTDEDEFVSLSCTDGGYRVLIKNPEFPQSSRLFFSPGTEALSVEADATYEAGPRNAAYGVGCWASREQGYIFAVSADGTLWGILRRNAGATPPQTVLAGSATEDAIPGFSDANRIRGECVGGEEEPTRLALYVNGKRIGTAEDRDGLASFTAVGFSVSSAEDGADVRFDNFAARAGTGG